MTATIAESRTESSSPFSRGQWIWTPGPARANHFALFTRTLPAPAAPVAQIRVCASYNYELYINGQFIGRGPVHGDPKQCRYDTHTYVGGPEEKALDIALVVHHSSGTHLHYQIPAPGGVIAEFTIDGETFGTNAEWRCRDLEMWATGAAVRERNWALDYCEDYDATREPSGWYEKRFPEALTADWDHAVLVPDSDTVWSGWEPRPVPLIAYDFLAPKTFWTWRATSPTPAAAFDCSRLADTEPLEPADTPAPFSLDALNAALQSGANAVTLDLGREWVGHYLLEVEAPEGVMLEFSGAELLQEQSDLRPWIFRKGTSYTNRFRTRAGVQELRSFAWTGCRYLHLVVRGGTEGVTLQRIGLHRRAATLARRASLTVADPDLARVVEICYHTLEIGTQEHLIDCPTREQTQYWGDAAFIAQSLWHAYGEPAYLRWYLDGFIHAPFTNGGQLSATYPSLRTTLIDYSLIPLIGQRFYLQNTGAYYRAEETVDKALRLKEWYDRHANADGLVAFDAAAYQEQGLINFVDHPGLGWHNFPHPGMDREGISCPINTFFYGFLRLLADLCASIGRDTEAEALTVQADNLAHTLHRTFWDGELYHDTIKDDGSLSEGTSWQTNCLMVFFDLVTGEPAAQLLRRLLDGYDRLCRCSPYFHFYLLPALRKAGMMPEALDLIRREWRPMLDADATSAWECFLGDDRDSLCHPWSTAPLLFLLEADRLDMP